MKSKITFNIVDDILNLDDLHKNHLIYCDTDSLFLTLPISLEKNPEKSFGYVNKIQDDINNDILDDFLHKHNVKIREKEETPLLPQHFKNEYMIKVIVLYAKKRYITITINKKKDGTIYYEEDLKGVEGKKGTYVFIKLLVEDLIEYLKSLNSYDDIYDRYDIYNLVIYKYYKLLKEYINTKNNWDKLLFFGFPVNVNKKIEDLKNVTGYYRGTLVYDSLFDTYWENRVGKGVWVRIKLMDESKIDDIVRLFSKYKNIKMKKNLLSMINDITIPDEFFQKNNDIINKIFDYVEIDFDTYFEVLLKKTSLLYKPFDITFCSELIKTNKKTIGQNFILVGRENIFLPKDIFNQF